MALRFTSLAEPLVNAEGGAAITCVGSFVLGRAYRVTAADNTGSKLCYSGVSGQGSNCFSRDGRTLPARLPPLAPGGIAVTVMDTETSEMVTIADVTRSETAFLSAQTFALRQNVRPILATGPTDPGQLADAETVPGFAQ
jgi:hypothetical protein